MEGEFEQWREGLWRALCGAEDGGSVREDDAVSAVDARYVLGLSPNPGLSVLPIVRP